MVPVEDKSPPHNLKLELNLHQADNANKNGNVAASSSLSPSAKILNFERQQNFNQTNIGQSTSGSPPKIKTETAQRPKTLIKPIQQQQHDMDINLLDHAGKAIEGGGGSSSGGSILACSSIGGSSDDGKKVKMTKIGHTKSVALKR